MVKMFDVFAHVFKWFGAKGATKEPKNPVEPFFMYLSVIVGKI